MKIIKTTILTICLTISILFLFVLFTSSGLKIGVAIASKIYGKNLQIENISGRLINHVHIKNLHVKQHGFRLNVQNIELKWKPLDLLTGRIGISKFQMQNAVIKLPKQKQQEKTIQKEKKKAGPINWKTYKIKLPLNFTIKNVSLKNILIKQNKSKTEIRSASLSFRTRNNKVYLSNLSFYTPPYQIVKLHGEVQLVYPFLATLNGESLTDFPAFHPIHTTLKLNGNIESRYDLSLITDKPFKATFNALLDQPLTKGGLNIEGEWKNLLFPIPGDNNIGSQSGRLTIQGTLQHYSILLDTDIAGSVIPAGHWKMTGIGNTKGVNLQSIHASTMQGTINSQLDLQWNPLLKWNTQLQARNINPGIKWPTWIGKISFNLKSHGQLSKKDPQFYLLLNNLTGKLHQHNASGHIDIAQQDKQININNSSLKIGEEILQANGAMSDHWNLTWLAKLPNITEVIPTATGSFYSKGKITGLRKTPTINSNVSMDKLTINKIYIYQLSGSSNFSFSPNQTSSIKITGKDLAVFDHNLQRLTISLSGLLKNHSLSIFTQAKDGTTLIRSHGGYDHNTLNETINQINIHSTHWHNWRLEAPFSLLISPKKILINPFSWVSNSRYVKGNFNWNHKTGWQAKLNINGLPTAFFDGYLPNNIYLHADINSNIDLSADNSQTLLGKANLGIANIKLINTNNKQKTILPNLTLSNTMNKAGLESNLKIGNQTSADNISIKLPGYHSEEMISPAQPINGSAKINFPYLNILPAFVPDISNTKGTLKTNLSFKGTFGNPIFDGTIDLKNIETNIKNFGLTLKNSHLSLSASNSDQLKAKGTIYTNHNPLNIEGNIAIDQFTFPFSFSFKGNNILAYNTNEYQIYVSPDLTFSYDKPKMFLKGSVNIPKALIAPKDFTTSTSLPSETVISTGSMDENLSQPIEFYNDLTLSLGNDVKLTYAGIEAQLGGKLEVKGNPNQLTTGSGELSIVKGKYDAYGTKLNIQRGNLIYTGGPIDNPGLDIRATKKVKHYVAADTTQSTIGTPNLIAGLQDVTVGLQVTGRLKQPKINLFSEPAGLKDSDILSYLLFGFPTSQASGAQSQLLFQAARSIQGVGKLTKGIQDTFGLTQFGFESEQVIDTDDDQAKQTTAFVMGKYLTPKLYLSYSVGLLVPINILRLRYALTKSLSVQTETSTEENGADLFYTIQTD